MSFDERGSLRAIVTAESAAALDLLRRESWELGRALNDAGVRADGQSFRFDGRGGDGSGGQQSQHGAPRQSHGGRGYAQQSPDQSSASYHSLRSSGSINLMA